jgi:hypothetical protein
MRKTKTAGALLGFAALAGLGVWVWGGSARAGDGEGTFSLEQGPGKYTSTQYFLVRTVPAGNPLNNYTSLHALGKPGGTLAVSTGTNKCGSYNTGSAWSTSTKFTGTLNQSYVLALTDDSTKPQKLQDKAFYAGTAPDQGKKFDSISVYKENANDTGTCVEGSNSYYKYQVTLEN